MHVRDRAAGAIVGLALGDALGAPFEFRRAADIPDPVPAFTLRWMGRPPGSWTDDTAMARNLWCSLLDRSGTLDTADVLRRHLDWLASDPPDVGNQTRLALRAAADGTSDAARVVFERRGPEVSAGNGSVMYCAPLGVVRAFHPERLLDEAVALSRITHWDGRCATACGAITLAVAALVRGEPPEPAVLAAVGAVAEAEGGEELEYLVGAAGRSRPVDGPDMGFTLFTAAVALRTVVEASDAATGMLDVVRLGGDTDTNAAVAGALLGARDGLGSLPPTWRDRLADGAEIEREAMALAGLAGAMQPR
ncbi:MAG TPA: ADP-ribosylglycohydrolase family protein [Actinomycetota bacterium]|nr:ADP-ribosylglycohydrolase family protein [Actinomycetota bacterium]